jgi:Trk K+ transport system NAD-binding subunit
MASVASGIVLGASAIPETRLLRRFKGQLTVLAVSVLFILLAADLSIASIFALGWGGFTAVGVLMFIIRPVNVGVCTLNSGLNWRQKLFICWVAPRGIVSASVASLFSILLTNRGINGGDSIKALVFLTIIMTVFLQGLTARWVASLLQITSKQATGALIVGCNPLGRLLGRLFQERGEDVVMLDTDPEACRLARQDNLRVFQSSGLDTEILEEAGLASMGTFLAVTSNGEVNVVLAQRAVEEFKPPRVLAVFPRDPQANTPNVSNTVQQAFDQQVSIKTWNQYLSDGAVKLGETVLKEGSSFQQAHLEALMRSGELVPLLIERDERFLVASTSEDWQAGDRLIYLLHDPTPKLLKLLSGSNQARLTLEKLPEVEEVPLIPPVLTPLLEETGKE